MRSPLRRYKAEFFKALAHPGRIMMLDALREGEKTVAELQALLVADEPASASHHLAILRQRNIVVNRKEGTTVYYSVRDDLLFDLLDVARTIFTNQLSHASDLHGMLEEEEAALTNHVRGSA